MPQKIHHHVARLSTLMISILLLIKPLWADESNLWQCTASDSESKQWVVRNRYERAAISKAFDACKKQSHVPISCKIDPGVCKGFDHEGSVSTSWQCTALDQNAKPWVGHADTSQDDAALAAQAICHKNSPVPDSCYINLLTCLTYTKH